MSARTCTTRGCNTTVATGRTKCFLHGVIVPRARKRETTRVDRTWANRTAADQCRALGVPTSGPAWEAIRDGLLTATRV